MTAFGVKQNVLHNLLNVLNVLKAVIQGLDAERQLPTQSGRSCMTFMSNTNVLVDVTYRPICDIQWQLFRSGLR